MTMLLMGAGLGSDAAPPVPSPVTGIVRAGSSGGGAVPWSNPSNVTADDGSYATVSGSAGTLSNPLIGMNPDREAVPDGATIDGIEVRIQLKNSDAGIISIIPSVQLFKGGVASGANRSDFAVISAADEIKTYGGPADLWDETWTPADVNASDFGARIVVRMDDEEGGEDTVSVDYISISVYFTP